MKKQIGEEPAQGNGNSARRGSRLKGVLRGRIGRRDDDDYSPNDEADRIEFRRIEEGRRLLDVEQGAPTKPVADLFLKASQIVGKERVAVGVDILDGKSREHIRTDWLLSYSSSTSGTGTRIPNGQIRGDESINAIVGGDSLYADDVHIDYSVEAEAGVHSATVWLNPQEVEQIEPARFDEDGNQTNVKFGNKVKYVVDDNGKVSIWRTSNRTTGYDAVIFDDPLGSTRALASLGDVCFQLGKQIDRKLVVDSVVTGDSND